MNHKENLNFFLNLLFKFHKVIIVLLFFIGFFFFYNIFLIDDTLESLKFSFDQSTLAYDIGDLEGIDLILSQLINDEMVPEKISGVTVANLEYARNVIQTGTNYRAIDSLTVSLGTVIKEKESQRSAVLRTLDWVNRRLRDGVSYLINLPRGILKPRKTVKPAKEDLDLLDRAKALEKNGEFRNAIKGYNEFINKYPSYEKTGLMRLRVASLYSRLGQYNIAMGICRDVIKERIGDKESYLSQALLLKLQKMGGLIRKEHTLLASLSEIGKDEVKKRQEVLYQLGAINVQLMNMDEAKKFFKRAVIVDPKSNLALKSRFNAAWVIKEEGKAKESLLEFSKIAEDYPESLLAVDSRYQLVDIYHREGRYKESVEMCLRLAEEYKGDPIAALCMFQAGASCMYDLNDEEKAKEIFSQLTKEYPDSIYTKFIAPNNPVGIFVTYLVPRATRVVMWRAGGLLALSGYSGELVKFEIRSDEQSFNRSFNEWLRKELPDTLGNIYVDIKGATIEFLKNKARGTGSITMGKFNVKGEAEGHLQLEKNGTINAVITRAILENIPIPPMLINNALTGITFIIRQNFPVIVTKIDMEKDGFSIEGYGSKRMLKRLQAVSFKPLGIRIDIRDIRDPDESKKLYALVEEKFPESEFSPTPKDDTESLFLDFFTRMYFYLSFKLLETIKDTKLDYERSVKTLGMLFVKKEKFKVTYKESDINASMDRLINNEFPWIVNEEFFFDVKRLKFHFTNEGEITFEANLGLGRTLFPVRLEEIRYIDARGTFFLDIDRTSRIPKLVFKSFYLNGKPFSLAKVNLVATRCLKLLKNSNMPFWLSEVEISEGSIILKGEGAGDFVEKLFSDPYLFVIFQVRSWDLWAAGIRRLKDQPNRLGNYFGDSAGTQLSSYGTGQIRK